MLRYLIVAIVAIVLPWAATASSAINCRTELPPAAREYWSWRIIDGKRCWYPGRPGMSKANLRWPQSEPELPPSMPKAPPGIRNEHQVIQPKDEVQSQGGERELPFKERWPH